VYSCLCISVGVCVYVCICKLDSEQGVESTVFFLRNFLRKSTACARGGGLGSRPKKMYGERLGDGVEYHLMKPTPRRWVPFTTGRRAH